MSSIGILDALDSKDNTAVKNNMNEWLHLIVSYGWYIGIPLLFLLIVFYVYRPKRRKRYRKDGEIPFQDDKHDHQ